MKVGVLGSGEVGRTLAAGFIKHGHEVTLGTRDVGKKSVQDWVGQTAGAKAATFEEAARFGEMLVLAVLGRSIDSVIELAGSSNFAGKTLIDVNNPIAEAAPVDGVLQYSLGPNESLAEQIQAKLPNAHVVKAFNSVGSALMVNPTFAQGTPTMFFCGDDEGARKSVSEIIRQFGWEPYDCGNLIAARAIEPLCLLWCLPGFSRNEWHHAFKMLTK